MRSPVPKSTCAADCQIMLKQIVAKKLVIDYRGGDALCEDWPPSQPQLIPVQACKPSAHERKYVVIAQTYQPSMTDDETL